jgi:hypothetical protein
MSRVCPDIRRPRLTADCTSSQRAWHRPASAQRAASSLLITRRSRVRIPPPLLQEEPRRSRGFSSAISDVPRGHFRGTRGSRSPLRHAELPFKFQFLVEPNRPQTTRSVPIAQASSDAPRGVRYCRAQRKRRCRRGRELMQTDVSPGRKRGRRSLGALSGTSPEAGIGSRRDNARLAPPGSTRRRGRVA